MKKTSAFLCALFSCAVAFADDSAAPFFADSNAVYLSLGGPTPAGLGTAAHSLCFLDGFNLGYQKIFKRFGIGVAFKTLTLEYDSDIILNYVQMNLKPVIVLNETTEDRLFYFMLYAFGSVVFRDLWVNGREGFSLLEFLPYYAGLGLGSEVNLLNHLSLYGEACFGRGGGVPGEFKPAEFDHYLVNAFFGCLASLEVGLKYYF